MVTYVQDYKLLDAVVHVLLILEKKKKRIRTPI